MIIKHFPMHSVKKSNFAGLVQYITDKQGKFERVGVCSITNCIGETVDDVIGEVLAVQQLNTRATSDKSYHLLVSFRSGENPDAETLKAIEEKICSGLGYDEHQRASVVHHDTNNIHLHIAINKIHPTKLTIREPYNAYRTFAKLSTALEKDHRLEADNHISRKSVSECRANDMERHSGIESLMTWIRKECLQQIRGSKSWDELHKVLSENGLQLLERGNGFVFKSSNGTTIKASTVARDLSKPQLEKRLGPFKKSNETIKKPKQEYNKQPIKMRITTDYLYAKYKKATQEVITTKSLELKRISNSKKRQINAAKRSNRLYRASIKLMKGRIAKKLLYAKAHKDFHEKIQSINSKYHKERQTIHVQFKKLTWLDWLKKEALSGNQEALNALRSRLIAKGLKGNTISGSTGGQQPNPFPTQNVIDNITKKGTKIIRINQTTVRYDGEKLQIRSSSFEENIQEALQFAILLYGPRITVKGTNQFKNQVVRAAVSSKVPLTFTDRSLESLRHQGILRGRGQDRRGMNQ